MTKIPTGVFACTPASANLPLATRLKFRDELKLRPETEYAVLAKLLGLGRVKAEDRLATFHYWVTVCGEVPASSSRR
jgi:hypothetical protein